MTDGEAFVGRWHGLGGGYAICTSHVVTYHLTTQRRSPRCPALLWPQERLATARRLSHGLYGTPYRGLVEGGGGDDDDEVV